MWSPIDCPFYSVSFSLCSHQQRSIHCRKYTYVYIRLKTRLGNPCIAWIRQDRTRIANPPLQLPLSNTNILLYVYNEHSCPQLLLSLISAYPSVEAVTIATLPSSFLAEEEVEAILIVLKLKPCLAKRNSAIT